MTFERYHFCDEAPRESRCAVNGEQAVVSLSLGGEALARKGLRRSLSMDAVVRFEAEFCPWCGERIREVAK